MATLRSPAAAAKGRERKRVLVSACDEAGEDDDDWVPQRRGSMARRGAEGGAIITGGKASKTGTVLARAQLASSPPGVVAAKERQTALLGKGKYRDAEAVAREGPVGSLATKNMPNHKGTKGSEAQFKAKLKSGTQTLF